jgi:hypothetical protein
LRHLKSKEAAISDVADEYQQRGSRLLEKLRSRHEKEQGRLVSGFDDGKESFVETCQNASKDMKQLGWHLTRVDLKTIMNGLQRSHTVELLRAVREEI